MTKIIMITKVVLSLLVFSVYDAHSQENTVGVERTVTRERTVIRVEDFDPNKVYDKNTGEKIPKNKVTKLLRENPNIALESVYDKAGNVERYLYDSNNHATFLVPEPNEKVKNGELFPEFLLTTSTGLKIDSKELAGKITLLRFMGEAEDYTMKMEEIKELNEKIENSAHKEKIEAFILFGNDMKSIESLFKLKDSNFKIVPNAYNFHRKFNIVRTPTTLVLNPDRTVENWYNYSEDINLETLLGE